MGTRLVSISDTEFAIEGDLMGCNLKPSNKYYYEYCFPFIGTSYKLYQDENGLHSYSSIINNGFSENEFAAGIYGLLREGVLDKRITRISKSTHPHTRDLYCRTTRGYDVCYPIGYYSSNRMRVFAHIPLEEVIRIPISELKRDVNIRECFNAISKHEAMSIFHMKRPERLALEILNRMIRELEYTGKSWLRQTN